MKQLSFSNDARKSASSRFPETNSSSLRLFGDKDFTVNSTAVNLTDELARGSYGVVYKGFMNNNVYAVKVEDFVGGEEQANILVELSILKSLSHPRLVHYAGAACVCKSACAGAKIMVLLELCENGALREFLQLTGAACSSSSSVSDLSLPQQLQQQQYEQLDHQHLPWNLLLRLASDVAEALQHLHSHGVVHRDVKTTNVLVDAACRAKLCDFSFACDVNSEGATKGAAFVYGTEEFMAPEIALGSPFGTAVDIFSFGIMLCEMITGKCPGADGFLHRSPRSLFAVNESELRDAIFVDCPEGLSAVALQCCDADSDYRPTAEGCVEALQMELMGCGGEESVGGSVRMLAEVFGGGWLLGSPVAAGAKANAPAGSVGLHSRFSSTSSDEPIDASAAAVEVDLAAGSVENPRTPSPTAARKQQLLQQRPGSAPAAFGDANGVTAAGGGPSALLYGYSATLSSASSSSSSLVSKIGAGGSSSVGTTPASVLRSLTSPFREGTVTYPRTEGLEGARAAVWGHGASVDSGDAIAEDKGELGDKAHLAGTAAPAATESEKEGAGASNEELRVLIKSSIGEFNNRFACMQLEIQELRAENRKLHRDMHSLLHLAKPAAPLPPPSDYAGGLKSPPKKQQKLGEQPFSQSEGGVSEDSQHQQQQVESEAGAPVEAAVNVSVSDACPAVSGGDMGIEMITKGSDDKTSKTDVKSPQTAPVTIPEAPPAPSAASISTVDSQVASLQHDVQFILASIQELKDMHVTAMNAAAAAATASASAAVAQQQPAPASPYLGLHHMPAEEYDRLHAAQLNESLINNVDGSPVGNTTAQGVDVDESVRLDGRHSEFVDDQEGFHDDWEEEQQQRDNGEGAPRGNYQQHGDEHERFNGDDVGEDVYQNQQQQPRQRGPFHHHEHQEGQGYGGDDQSEEQFRWEERKYRDDHSFGRGDVNEDYYSDHDQHSQVDEQLYERHYSQENQRHLHSPDPPYTGQLEQHQRRQQMQHRNPAGGNISNKTSEALQSFLSTVGKTKSASNALVHSIDRRMDSLPSPVDRNRESQQPGRREGGSGLISSAEVARSLNNRAAINASNDDQSVNSGASGGRSFSYARGSSPLSSRVIRNKVSSPQQDMSVSELLDQHTDQVRRASTKLAPASASDQRNLSNSSAQSFQGSRRSAHTAATNASGTSNFVSYAHRGERANNMAPYAPADTALAAAAVTSCSSTGAASPVPPPMSTSILSNKKNSIIHTISVTPRCTTGSSSGSVGGGSVGSARTPQRHTVVAGRAPAHLTTPGTTGRPVDQRTPASASNTWRETKTPFARPITPSERLPAHHGTVSSALRHQQREHQLQRAASVAAAANGSVAAGANLFSPSSAVTNATFFGNSAVNNDYYDDAENGGGSRGGTRPVSPTSTIRSNTTSGTNNHNSRLPPPPSRIDVGSYSARPTRSSSPQHQRQNLRSGQGQGHGPSSSSASVVSAAASLAAASTASSRSRSTSRGRGRGRDAAIMDGTRSFSPDGRETFFELDPTAQKIEMDPKQLRGSRVSEGGPKYRAAQSGAPLHQSNPSWVPNNAVYGAKGAKPAKTEDVLSVDLQGHRLRPVHVIAGSASGGGDSGPAGRSTRVTPISGILGENNGNGNRQPATQRNSSPTSLRACLEQRK